MTLLYIVGFIDRSNVGFAALTMNRDLGFSPAVFGLGAGMFFLGYLTFQIPTAVLLARLGARRVIFCVMLVWGLVSAGNAFMRDAHSFYALRFLLGVAEGGFTPSMIFFLTLWFPPEYRGRFTATFCSAIPIAGILSGPLSGLLLGMDGIGGLHGWQWLFLIQGLPAALLAFVVLRVLPDNPAQASWLDDSERAVIAARLADAAPPERKLAQALLDPRLLLLGISTLGSACALYGITLWLPQIIQAMGFSNRATGFVAAIPYVVSMAAMILWGRRSDARNERIWHTAATMLLAAGALAAAGLWPGTPALVLVALTCAMAGGLAGIGPFQSLLTSFARGPAAAGGLALVNSIGTVGGFLGPVVVGLLKGWTGNFGWAMAALGIGQALSALIVLLAGRMLKATASPGSRPSPSR